MITKDYNKIPKSWQMRRASRVLLSIYFEIFRFLFIKFKSFYKVKNKNKNKSNTRQFNTRQFNTRQEQYKTRQIKANQGNTRQYKAIQGKSRQIKAIQGKRGDILPVIMLFFKSSHQFLYRSQDIRTNVSITLFFFFIKFKSF